MLNYFTRAHTWFSGWRASFKLCICWMDIVVLEFSWST
jgi:hypothetical protein